MFIEKDDLERLEEELKKTYDRDLRGNQLGQFHPDFRSVNGRTDVLYSKEAIFLIKKLYAHELLLSDNTIDYVFRGKGLTTASILAAARRRDGVMSLYKYIYHGIEEVFDLAEGSPCFKMNPNMTIQSLTPFTRRIKA